MESLSFCIYLEAIGDFVRDFVAWEHEIYTCKHFGYSNWLSPMDVDEFLFFDPRNLCLWVCKYD